MSSILRQTVLIAVTFILAAIHSVAGSFTNLYNFRDIDGANPSCNLLLSGNCLIGVAVSGGSGGGGTLFNLNTDGDDFTKLFNFGGATGANPYAGLILSGTSLYGTTGVGGSGGNGTMFKISTNGMGFTNLYNFSGGGDGANPYAGLVLCGDILYGTTWGGGSAGNGTLFKINSDGTGYSNFYSFTAAMNSGFAYTNRDGANPFASLVLSGNTLYGTTWVGGSSAAGTVFKVNTDGTAFTNLHSFSGSDGARPTANLVLSGNTLYGTTWEGGGGSPGKGTVFKINADGTGFTNLHNFSGGDGANPYAGLALSGKTLYGTTWGGGSAGNGTVFKANIDGSGFTNLHVFTTTIYNGSAYTNRDGQIHAGN